MSDLTNNGFLHAPCTLGGTVKMAIVLSCSAPDDAVSTTFTLCAGDFFIKTDFSVSDAMELRKTIDLFLTNYCDLYAEKMGVDEEPAEQGREVAA